MRILDVTNKKLVKAAELRTLIPNNETARLDKLVRPTMAKISKL